MARRSREEAAEDSSTVGAAPSSRKCRKAVYGLPESLKDLSLSFRTENSLLCPASTKQVHRLHVCGRVIQASPPNQLGLKIIDALDPRDNRVPGDPFGNVPPRYNGAPSQQLWVIPAEPSNRRALARPASVGAHPMLVQGQAEAAADQRQGGDGRPAADVP